MIAENKDAKFITFGVVNEFVYTNYREERQTRRMIPLCLRFGTSPHHVEKTWILECIDCEKMLYRTLALNEIEIPETHTTKLQT